MPELQRLSMLQHALPRLRMAVTCLAGGMHNHEMPMPTGSLPGEQDVGEPPWLQQSYSLIGMHAY